MMNNKFLIAVILFIVIYESNSQPIKRWSKLFGGDGTEQCLASTNVNDSLIAVVGTSNSANLGNKGLTDMIIGVVNKNSNLKNFKTFGSPQADQLNAVDVLPNGQLICAGQINGSGGDVASIYGLIDGYLLLYDPIKNTKVWAKNIGGTNNDQISDVKFLEPGKILFCGSSKSLDKDFPPNAGGFDSYVGTIDEAGNLVRIKTFAGSKDDLAKRIGRISEREFYLAGETLSSNEGAFLGLVNKGKKDIFVLKLNRNSNQLSAIMFGGPGDEILIDIVSTADGGFIVVLNVTTAGGDIDSLIGGKDIFVMKYNSAGTVDWKRMIGGTKDDEAVTAKLNDKGELLIVATSNSTDRDVKSNYGDKDVMLWKLSDKGEILSFSNYGGTRGDAAGSLVSDGPNTYLVSSSSSTNNDLPSNNAIGDFWVLALFECSTAGVPYNPSICIGDTVVVGTQKFYAGNSSGRVVLPKAAIYGCDSIVDVDVTLNSATTEFLRDTLCFDATFTVNNLIFDRNNTAHTFKLKNFNGCDSSLIVELKFNSQIEVSDTMIKSDNGTNNGYIHIGIIGGAPPYSFEWSNGARTIDLDNIPSGTYTLRVRDNLGCVRDFSFFVKSTVATIEPTYDNIKILQTKSDIIIESEEVITGIDMRSIDGTLNVRKTFNDRSCRMITQDFTKGIYLLEVQMKTGQKIIRKIGLY